jgi:DNA adenine methylase
MRSPIKYFGGKNGMFKEIIKHFPPIEDYKIYCEPFGGSAALLFQKEPSPIEVYNDIEENVWSLFKTLNDPQLFAEFKHRLDLTYYGRQFQEEFRQRLKEKELSIVERAYTFFCLNRMGYSGVGGFAKSKWPRRGMSKSVSDFLSAIDGLMDVHLRLSSVVIERRDAFRLIPEWDSPDTFLYCDPPYHPDTRTAGKYVHDWTPEDHTKFVDLLLSALTPFMGRALISGYANPEYQRLEDRGWRRIDFEVKSKDKDNNTKLKIESLWANYADFRDNEKRTTQLME